MFRIYNEQQQKDVYRLWVVLLVEFIGTFAMVFWIIAPNSLGWSNSEQSTELAKWMYIIFFSTYIGVAFYVSTFILLLIFLFRNISVNLNPAISLSEVAAGNLSWNKAVPMIAVQFLGAIVAAVLAYELIDIIGTEFAKEQKATDQFALDSLSPRLRLPQVVGLFKEEGWNNYEIITVWYEDEAGPESLKEWSFGLVVFAIEFVFTFGLISSVIYGKNTKHNARPFVIYGALLLIVTLGCITNNVAINPARLLAPAMVTQVAGGLGSMQYQFIYLAGELGAVLLIFWIESNKEKEVATCSSAHKIVVSRDSLLQEDSSNLKPLVIKLEIQLLKNDNKDLSKLDKNELISVARELNIVFDNKESRNDIVDIITEYLVFGEK